MKLTLMLVNIIFLGLTVATPLSSPNDPADLEGRNPGKCEWKDRCCCQYQDTESKDNHWEYGNEHDHKHSRTIYVRSGKSIQHAINSVSRGDPVDVAAGTYSEQLTIDTNGIQLISHNSIIVPPTKPVQNECSGLSGTNTQAGIWINGSGVNLAHLCVSLDYFLLSEANKSWSGVEFMVFYLIASDDTEWKLNMEAIQPTIRFATTIGRLDSI